MLFSFPKVWFVQLVAGEARVHRQPNIIRFCAIVKSEMLASGTDTIRRCPEGLKARHVIAWGEAPGGHPKTNSRRRREIVFISLLKTILRVVSRSSSRGAAIQSPEGLAKDI